MIEAWFDGACEPWNPGGHGSYGAIVKVDGVPVLEESYYLGDGSGISNNVAEYAGCIRVLRKIKELEGKAIIRGDSMMVIRQLSRDWGANGGIYLPYYYQAIALADELRDRIEFQWIPRQENATCDELSKRELLSRNISFRERKKNKHWTRKRKRRTRGTYHSAR